MESAVYHDVRGTPQYEHVAEFARRYYAPGFGRPHALNDPQVSRDGTKIIITGAVFDELLGTPRSAIYSVAKGTFSPITAALGSAYGGRLSPDGRLLAFLSDRAAAGVFQPYLLDADRFGEAVSIPAVPGNVEYLRWSPDGRKLLLGVADLGPDMLGLHRAGHAVDKGGHLPSWSPQVVDATSSDIRRTLWIYSRESGAVSRVSPAGLNCWEANWCGPSQVLVVSTAGCREDDWYQAELTLLDLRTATTRRLLQSDVQLGHPVGSQDGRVGAVVAAVCSDRGVVAGDITLLDIGSGRHTAIDSHGVDVTCLQWIDENHLGYVGQRHLESVGGIVDARAGTVTENFATDLSCGANLPEAAFLVDGKAVVAQSAYHIAPRVALLNDRGVKVLASTAHPGTAFLSSGAGHAAATSWRAPDGLEIEGIVCRPATAGPAPLVTVIHGGPVWAFRNMWAMSIAGLHVPLLVSLGYAVLCPNPRGSFGRGREFASSVVGDMGGPDAADIVAGVDALINRRFADPDRLALLGQSYGGFMAGLLTTRDQRFAAAVPIAPVSDWYSMTYTSEVPTWGRTFLAADPAEPGSRMHSRSPALNAQHIRTPCLNVAGARDRCTPPDQARELHQALLANGVQSMLAIYPLEGHGVRSFPAVLDFLTRVILWFTRHLPPPDHPDPAGPGGGRGVPSGGGRRRS